MALVRVYCGLASAEPTGRPATAGTGLTAAVVDDAGRLLDVCEITDDPAGYARLGALLAERANGPGSAAIAADSDDHQVTSLLSAAGRPLAIADDDAVDDFAERFADDDSIEEMESPAAERRAVGLARALQAGAIFAIGLPVPRDLAPYRPILAAHSALAGGRHSAAATLREVLRELYPAALRAYSDPAEPLTLAVLDALPEPGMVSGAAARGRDLPPAAEAVAKRLTTAGVGDEATVREAITALRVAIAETPRRGIVNKALASASSDAVRQAVAAVRSCDEGCAALVATLTARTTPVTAVPRRPMRPVGPVAEPETETETATTPAGLHALPLPLPERAGRRHRPEPAAATTTPRALTTPPVAPAPVAPPPTAPSPISTTSAAPFAEPPRPTEPQRNGDQSRPSNAPRVPAASRRAAEPRTSGRSEPRAGSRSGEPRTPTRSTDPLTPTRSAGSLGAMRSGEGLTPARSTDSLTSTRSIEPLTPARSAEELTPTRPGEGLTPPRSIEPLTATRSGEDLTAMRSGEDLTPTRSIEPLTPTRSGEDLTPTRSIEPRTPARSAGSLRPTRSTGSRTPTRSTEPLGPTRSAEPLGPTRSAEPLGPTRSAEPLGPTRSTDSRTPTRSAAPPAATPISPAAFNAPTPAGGTPMPSRSPGHAWSTGFDGTTLYEQPRTAEPPRPPKPAMPQAPTPAAPAASATPLPGRPVSGGPANRPVSVPPPPPGITPIPAQRPTIPPAEAGEPFRATLTNAALNSARAERKRPTVIPPRTNGRSASTQPPAPPVNGFQATDLSLPVPAPRPEPGARANWPLVDSNSDERANGEPHFPDLSELPPSELDRPTYSPVDDRVTPPWLADDMPPEPPILRLVEPPPLADRALRDDGPPRETRSRNRAERSDHATRYDAPPLRLVESPTDTGSHPLPVGISAPPVSDDEGDGDLLIFAAARSAWFTGQPEEEEDLSWSSDADTGWRAAEKASSPSVGLETHSGLPRRVPQANLVPGSPIHEERPLRIVRDAASIAAHTTGYFRGWRRGQEIGGYAVGGRPGREAAGGWDFSRDHGGRDESQEYEYRSART